MGAKESKQEKRSQQEHFDDLWGQMSRVSKGQTGGNRKTKKRSVRKPTRSARKFYSDNRKKSQCVGKSKAFCARTRAKYRPSGGITKGCKWASGPRKSFCRSAGNERRSKRSR